MNEKPEKMDHESPERIPGLEYLYDSDWLTSDEGEEEYLHPISKMLEDMPEHYVDEEFIGAGGEKRVFKVRDQRTDRVVALARPQAGSTTEEKEQFLREARLTACLQHPNIISIYDIASNEEDGAFFTMQFIHGDTLHEVIEKLKAGDSDYLQRFPLSRLLELFIRICDAVAYAHSRNVLHLDLKPANIFVGPFGEVLVFDWGLAKIIVDRGPQPADHENLPLGELPDGDILNNLTQRGIIRGTPGFMAPEQFGRRLRVSKQTDIYSLGALLYYVLTHRPTITGTSLEKLAKLTHAGKIELPSKVVFESKIPDGVEAVAMKALKVDPNDRYESVKQLRNELESYLLGFATEAQQAGWLVKFMLLLKRRRHSVRVALLSGLVLVGIVILAFVSLVEEKKVTEDNLRLYIEETEHSRALSDTIRATAMDLINAEDFMHAEGKIRAIESQLSQETDPAKIHALTEHLALLHFVMQDFNQAVEYFGRIDVRKRFLHCEGLASKYAKMKPNDNLWLDPQDMRQLLIEMKRHLSSVTYYLAYYYFNKAYNQPKDELTSVVEVMLDILNYQSIEDIRRSSYHAEQDELGWHLSLKGSPYAIFRLPIAVPGYESNVLKFLHLYSLDVSYSALNDIERLQELQIKELNIAGIDSIPKQKFYMFAKLKVERVYHTLEHSDEYLAEHAPAGVEFIRVQDGD